MFVIKLINRNVFKSLGSSTRCISCFSNYLNNSSEKSFNLKLTPFKTPHSITSGTDFQCRFKYNKSSKNKREVEDNELEDDLKEFEEHTDGKNTKVITTKVTSLRMDLLIKVGLGLARNKVENAFYDSRIRVNGQKVLKKSVSIYIGDEIDVIKGFSPMNPEHLIVSRVEILSATANEEDISVTMRKLKSLTIENYTGQNVYKAAVNNT